MKTWTKLVVAGLPGFLFYTTSDCDNLAFVPMECINTSTGELDADVFLVGLWPWSNCFANPVSFYSHVWPDLDRPAPPNAPGIDEFVARLAIRINGTR